MSIVKNKTKYKKRIVDSLIERDLKIFGQSVSKVQNGVEKLGHLLLIQIVNF